MKKKILSQIRWINVDNSNCFPFDQQSNRKHKINNFSVEFVSLSSPCCSYFHIVLCWLLFYRHLFHAITDTYRYHTKCQKQQWTFQWFTAFNWFFIYDQDKRYNNIHSWKRPKLWVSLYTPIKTTNTKKRKYSSYIF